MTEPNVNEWIRGTARGEPADAAADPELVAHQAQLEAERRSARNAYRELKGLPPDPDPLPPALPPRAPSFDGGARGAPLVDDDTGAAIRDALLEARGRRRARFG